MYMDKCIDLLVSMFKKNLTMCVCNLVFNESPFVWQ